MSDDPEYMERTTVEAPTSVRREEVRVVRANNTGWWIALLIAVVAVVGAFFWINANQNSQTELQAARDQGAAQAQLDNATANAQAAATQATSAAQSAVTGAAQATQHAADAAASRAENAADRARDAAATEPANPPPPQ